jgi:hypothetical protein
VSRLTALVLVLAATGSGAGASAARVVGHSSTILCVAARTGCYSALQHAFDAARDGDTITIAPGTYAGGATVDVSVTIVGAGATSTTIKGGGPVLTLGKEFAAVEPTISISGITITGGRNTSVPDHAVTQGGGIRIPQAASFTTGATVTIRNRVITHNAVAPEQLLPAGFCGPVDCSFASGAGISNDGTLTLIDTAVTNNVVSDNHSQLSTTLSSAAGPLAFAGGIALSNGSDAISRTTIVGNTVTGDFMNSDALAFGGGIFVDGDATLTLDRVAIAQNRVDAQIPQTSPGATLTGGGGLSVNGVVTIRDSRIALNHILASAAAGTVRASGGGIANFGQTPATRTDRRGSG